jgi:hypothetical protein
MRDHCFGVSFGNNSFLLELLRQQRANGRVCSDLFVHARLGEGWLVALVVSPAAVADQVDQEILAEHLAVGVGHARHRDAGDDIVGVDMDDRDLEAFGQVAGIQRRARIAWIGGEADLVVGDDMDGAAGAVAGQLR